MSDLSLDIREGEVLGIAGPNGAGKSTLIALLLGYLAPSEGRVTIDGEDPRRYVERHGIGYLSELVHVPPAWRVATALERYALLAGVAAGEARRRADEVIEMLGLEEHRGKRVRQLSKGNLQRLGLAQALLRHERVVVLDEPTHGLDPVWTQRFRDIVTALRRPDRALLIASHNLDELARLADRVAIIDRGTLQRIVDVRAPASPPSDGVPYRVQMAHGDDAFAARFPSARAAGRGEFELAGVSLADLNTGLASLIQRGALVRAVYPVHTALEQQFREAVRADVDADDDRSA